MTSYLQLDETRLNRAGALWTAREIAQQPASWRRTQDLLRQHAALISGFLTPLLAKPDLRIILTGAGSSAFIGECLAPLLLRRLDRRVEAIADHGFAVRSAPVFSAGRAHAARFLWPLRRQPGKHRSG